MAWVGYEVFHEEPGKRKSMKCLVCGTKCLVTRNIKGATSWGSAMMGTSKLHDMFICPYAEEEAHDLALELFKQAEESASVTIGDIIRKDLKKVLAELLLSPPPSQKDKTRGKSALNRVSRLT
jgi:hypothetical protein